MFNVFSFIGSIAEMMVLLVLILNIFDPGDGLFLSIFVAVSTGVVNFVVPMLSQGAMWLAPILLVVMMTNHSIVLNQFYWRFDYKEDSLARPYASMVILLGLMCLTTISSAHATVATLGEGWRFILYIPYILTGFAFLFMVYDGIAYRHGR